jgi:hypothetical protein
MYSLTPSGLASFDCPKAPAFTEEDPTENLSKKATLLSTEIVRKLLAEKSSLMSQVTSNSPQKEAFRSNEIRSSETFHDIKRFHAIINRSITRKKKS